MPDSIILEKEVMTMRPYAEMTTEMLQAEYAAVKEKFEVCKKKNLKLNMARGKPSKVQLDIAAELLTVIQKPEDCLTVTSMRETTVNWLACPAPVLTGQMCWAVSGRKPSLAAHPA